MPYLLPFVHCFLESRNVCERWNFLPVLEKNIFQNAAEKLKCKCKEWVNIHHHQLYVRTGCFTKCAQQKQVSNSKDLSTKKYFVSINSKHTDPHLWIWIENLQIVSSNYDYGYLNGKLQFFAPFSPWRKKVITTLVITTIINIFVKFNGPTKIITFLKMGYTMPETYAWEKFISLLKISS